MNQKPKNDKDIYCKSYFIWLAESNRSSEASQSQSESEDKKNPGKEGNIDVIPFCI